MASPPQCVQAPLPPGAPERQTRQEPWTERMVTLAAVCEDDSKPANLKDISVKAPKILLKPPASRF